MSEIIEKETIKQNVKPPVMWNVVMINDEYTTFEFVLECLRIVFGKGEEQAFIITKAIHEQGKGIVGTYTKDIAVTKQIQAMEMAQREEHPLQVKVEPNG